MFNCDASQDFRDFMITWKATVSQRLFTNILYEQRMALKAFYISIRGNRVVFRQRNLLVTLLMVAKFDGVLNAWITICSRLDDIRTKATGSWGFLDDRHSHRGFWGSRAWQVSLRDLARRCETSRMKFSHQRILRKTKMCNVHVSAMFPNLINISLQEEGRGGRIAGWFRSSWSARRHWGEGAASQALG